MPGLYPFWRTFATPAGTPLDWRQTAALEAAWIAEEWQQAAQDNLDAIGARLRLLETNTQWWLLSVGDEPIARASLRVSQTGVGGVVAVYVRADHRGRGHAAAALAMLSDYAVARGVTSLALTTASTIDAGGRWMAALGATPTRSRDEIHAGVDAVDRDELRFLAGTAARDGLTLSTTSGHYDDGAIWEIAELKMRVGAAYGMPRSGRWRAVEALRRWQRLLEAQGIECWTVCARAGTRLVGFAEGLWDPLEPHTFRDLVAAVDGRGSGFGAIDAHLLLEVLTNRPGIRWLRASALSETSRLLPLLAFNGGRVHHQRTEWTLAAAALRHRLTARNTAAAAAAP